MFLSVKACVLLIVLCAQLSQGQILEEEVPNELQFILKWDLDTWEPPEEISKKYIYYLSGFDEDNRPIWVLEFGKWDIKAIVDKGEVWEKALDKHIDQWLWRMYNSSGMRSTPKNRVNEIETIVDMEGYTIRQMSSSQALAFVIRKVRLIVIAMQFAHVAYCVNTNFVAHRLLNILKPILGKEFEKLEIFGTNPKKWIPKVLKYIPRDQLPEWYGGNPGFKPLQVFG